MFFVVTFKTAYPVFSVDIKFTEREDTGNKLTHHKRETEIQPSIHFSNFLIVGNNQV